MMILRMYLKYNDHVAWFHSWHLVSLSMEGDALLIPHALIYCHLQQLGLLHHLTAQACLAAVTLIYYLT